MANATTTVQVPSDLRGLVLSASELRQLTDWPEPLIEDYLAILENLQVLANAINTKNDILKNTELVDFARSPFEIPATEEEIFFDTTDGEIIANLSPGEDGRNYRLVNIGNAGNKVTLNPFGTEKLFGVNAPEFIYDQEALILTFDVAAEGWN